jgi:hypothetical protein
MAQDYGDGNGSPVSNSDSYGEESGGTGHNAGPVMSKQMMQQSESEMVARLDIFTPAQVRLADFLDTLSEKDVNFLRYWGAGHPASVIASVYRKDVKWARNNFRRIKRLAQKWKNRGKSQRNGCLRCEGERSRPTIPPVGPLGEVTTLLPGRSSMPVGEDRLSLFA